MQCVQGIQPNVPALTTCRHGLYKVCARTQVCSRGTCTYFKGTCTYQNRPNMVCAGTQVCSRGMCMNHRVIYRLTLHAPTNAPPSSARLPTSFQQPRLKGCTYYTNFSTYLMSCYDRHTQRGSNFCFFAAFNCSPLGVNARWFANPRPKAKEL